MSQPQLQRNPAWIAAQVYERHRAILKDGEDCQCVYCQTHLMNLAERKASHG